MKLVLLIAATTLLGLLSLRATQCHAQGTTLSETARQGPAWDLSHGRLKVAENGRFLVHEDGTPFLYLSDTNWELFHRAGREAAERLLDHRRSQGFTVVFGPVTGALDCMHFHDPLGIPNRYGDLPFVDKDVTRPAVTEGASFDDAEQYDYWDHVDHIIDIAEAKGLHVGIIPAWHGHYKEGYITAKNARQYGRFLGKRFGNRQNIFWVLGGDTNVPSDERARAHHELAAGIRGTEAVPHVMSFHPRGGNSSSKWFHDSDWIDFNMIQSGHGARDLPNFQKIQSDYARRPIRPVLDGENRYEDHAVNWNTVNGWFNDYDNRQAAYWSLFAGSFGHTYGTRGVWQMWEPGREKYTWLNHYWYDAMNLPGGWDMLHVRELILSRPFASRVPDQSLVADEFTGKHHLQACRGAGYAFVYCATGKTFEVDLRPRTISGEVLIGWWFDPRTGETNKIGEFENGKLLSFDPPGGVKRGNDWILVLDDKAKNWKPPGTVDLISTSATSKSAVLDHSPLALPTGTVDMVLDSDVFNEVDDQFALSFAVRSTKRISLKAVYAAPFKNHRSTSAKDGMEKSYHEAKRVLGILGVPAEGRVFRGSDRFLPNRDTAVDSEAARHLIRLAHQPREGRLYVVGLGVASNIASAILLDPSIKERIVVVWIGGHPHSWPHARDFNLNQDIAAAQILFDSEVPLVHIPAGDVAAKLGISLPELETGMKGRSTISDDLYASVEKYYGEINASKKAPRSGEGAWRKVIWDIATVAWLVGSEGAVQTKVVPSPMLTDAGEWQEKTETDRHNIRVAAGLDRNQIFDMLFETLADEKRLTK